MNNAFMSDLLSYSLSSLHIFSRMAQLVRSMMKLGSILSSCANIRELSLLEILLGV